MIKATGRIGKESTRCFSAAHMTLENISAHVEKTKVAWMVLWIYPVIATKKVPFGPVMMEELLPNKDFASLGEDLRPEVHVAVKLVNWTLAGGVDSAWWGVQMGTVDT